MTAPQDDRADPDCELAEVQQELEFHRRTFAGRDEVLRKVSAWLEAPSPLGAYLLLLGPPGQGKSALLAEVSRRAGEKYGCVVHLVKSHRNPLRFVPALVRQAARLAGVSFGPDAYRGDVDDLRNSLVRALEALRERRGHAVVVLDALDELDSPHERLSFLPEVLPAGVKAVLSCRPDIPLVQALRARLRRLEEWNLRPLSPDDLWPVLRRRLQAELPPERRHELDALADRVAQWADWPGLFDRLGGNPLFLHRALDQVVRSVRTSPTALAPIPLESFPANLEAFFEAVYGDICEKEGTRHRRPEGRLKGRMLQFLCLAREPLGIDALSELLAADGFSLSLEDCRDRLWEMSPYLLMPAGQRFKPWHQGLADHVRDHILGPAGCQGVERVFAAWLRRPSAAYSLYALRHRLRHLLAANLAEEGAELLATRAFVEARAREEPIHDLVNDFTDTVAALPGDHPLADVLRLLEEALRTDLHFLARRPEALLQCVYNRGWWYDSPAAARFYLPSEGVPPWERAGPKLSALVESWLADRERAEPGFRWLRSLRPPEVPLGTSQRMVFRGHEAGVSALVLLPPGDRLASGSEDHTVRVWEIAGGEEVLRLEGHTKRVQGLAASPDGRWLASASDDRTIRVWDAHDGREILVLVGHRGPVTSVAWSPDGETLASGGDDRTVRLWQAATGRALACLRGHRRWVEGVAFAPDSALVASASGDGSVRVWDVRQQAEVLCLQGHTDAVACVAFAPDGGLLASGGRDGAVRFWAIPGGQEVRVLEGYPRGVRCVAFLRGGAVLAAAGESRTIMLRDVRSGRERGSLVGHEAMVRGLVELPGGLLASCSADATVRIWDPAGGDAPLPQRGHTSWVTSVTFSPDGRWVASGAGDRTVWLCSLEGDEQRVLTGHTDRVWAVAFSPDSRRVASGSRDRTVRIFDIEDGRERMCLVGHEEAVRGVAYSPDGRFLASASKDRTVRLWDTARGVEVLRLGGHDSAVIAVTFSPDGRLLASGTLAGQVRMFALPAGEEVAQLSSAPDDVDALAFSPDGHRLAGCSLRWTVRLWDVTTGECVRTFPGTACPRAAAAGPGRFPYLVVGHRWETVVEDARTGEVVGRLPGTLHRLTTHPSGRLWAGTHANHVHLFALEGG